MFMKRTVALGVGVVLAFSFAVAFSQQSEPEGESRDIARQRAEWFARERGVEVGRLPSGLRAQAVRRLEAMRADERRRAAAMASGSTLSATAGSSVSSTPWKPIGPSAVVDPSGMKNAGRVSSLAVDPRNPLVVYAGAADGGVWKTSDGGQSWTPLTDTQPSLSIGSIALDPSAPDTVYVGTGEFNGADGYPGVGILKSTDGGTTWTNIQGPFVPKSSVGYRIPAVAVSPANSQIVLAAAASLALAQGTEGVFRSTDGGTTWTNVLRGGLGATSVVFDPRNTSVAYAGIVNTDTNGNRTVKLLKSADAGVTWTATALPESPGDRIMAIVAPSDSSVYVAYTINNATGDRAFLFRSRDGGASFTELNDSQICTFQCGYNLAMTVNPTDSNELFFGGGNTFDTTDGGATWEYDPNIHTDEHALSFSATGDRVYLGTDGGMYVATNLSRPVQFATINNGLANLQFYPGISIAPGNPSFGLGGMQDNGTARYSGTAEWEQVYGSDGFSTAIDPLTPSTFYLSTQQGFIYKTTDNGAHIQSASNGLSGSAAFNTVFTIDHRNPNNLYTVRSGTVFQSTDGASSWSAISPQLSSLSNSDIEVAPSDSNTVWVSGCCGAVFVSRNAGSGAGATWTQLNGPTKRPVTAIAISPADPTTAYVVVSGFAANYVGVDQVPGHVFKVTAGGTWTDMTGNLPDIPMSAIAIDPAIPDTFYVGTDIGVFTTSNAGASWDTAVTNLPRSAVMALALDAPTRTLRAATHGRGMFDLQLPAAATCSAPATDGVQVCAPDEGATVESPVAVRAEATITGGVYRFELWVDHVKVLTVRDSGTMDSSVPMDAGSHLLEFVARNAAGDHVSATRTISVGSSSGSCSAPAGAGVNVCSPQDGSTVDTTFAVDAAANVSGGVYRFELWANGTKVLTVRDSGVMKANVTLNPGAYKLDFVAQNAAGTHVSATVHVTVGGGSACTTPTSPAVNVCSPQDGATVGTSFPVQAYANVTGGVYRFELWANGSKVLTVRDSGTMNTTVTLPAGAYRLDFVAQNSSGTHVSKTINVTVQ